MQRLVGWGERVHETATAGKVLSQRKIKTLRLGDSGPEGLSARVSIHPHPKHKNGLKYMGLWVAQKVLWP